MLGRYEVGRQGSVAVWIALMIPLLVDGDGVWSRDGRLGGRADVSPTDRRCVGERRAMNYKASLNAQTAATFAARMAQLNGASGTASPTWSSSCSGSCTSPCTGTLTDNQIIAQVISCSGAVTNSDVMIKVSVQKTVPAAMSSLFSSTSSYTHNCQRVPRNLSRAPLHATGAAAASRVCWRCPTRVRSLDPGRRTSRCRIVRWYQMAR
jgi:hypothetical protein